jgi:plastocyanin
MSILGRRVSIKVIAFVVVLLVVGTMLAAVSRTPSREITLVTRDMAFYLEDDPLTPNPTITVKASERVRIVLRNEERGIRHDFAVPALRAATNQIDWNEAADVAFDVPRQPGSYDYLCQPHAQMMHGRLVVQ